MHFRIIKNPPIANKIYFTIKDLIYGFQWYKNATPAMRERFHERRLNLIKKHAPFSIRECKSQQSSGSTGHRKNYFWGPNFTEVDHFFHLLVKDGERLKKTVHVNAVSLFDIQQHNSIETIERPETYSVNKIIWLKINGAGPVPDLKKEMSDHNVYMSPSMFNLLESYIQVSDYFDKDAIIIFTGECLGEETKEYLINKGFSVRDEMRSWDGGATFYTCRFGECHWVDYLAPTSVDDNNKLIATDLFNVAQMYVNYHNGDFVKKTTTSTCACGMVSTKNEFLNRSAFTLFKSPTGHLLNYDLIFNTFTNVGGTIPLQLCIGKYKKPIDSNIIINYITNKKVDEQLIQEEFYQTFGLKVKLENYIKPDYFKIKKIYWIDDDKLHNS